MLHTLPGAGIAGWLRLLAAENATPQERNEAAGRLLAAVSAWAAPYVRRTVSSSLDEADIDEVVQHLLARSATGSSRFRGTTEGEAHKWCMRVLSNKAQDVCRRRRRLAYLSRRAKEDVSEEDLGPEPSVEPELETIAAHELSEMLEAVAAELPPLHRLKDVDGLLRSLRCHVEARLGATIEDQLEAYGFGGDDDRTPQSFARARSRVYQYRARGRAAGCEALSALVVQRRFTPEDVVGAQRLLGCEVLPASRRERAEAS
jgi:DNA-directed RNA polymerase specialized sigma24 family protein